MKIHNLLEYKDIASDKVRGCYPTLVGYKHLTAENLKRGLLRRKDRFLLKVGYFIAKERVTATELKKRGSVIRENQTGFPYEERAWQDVEISYRYINKYYLFTPLESPAIYGGDEKYKGLIPFRKGGVKARPF